MDKNSVIYQYSNSQMLKNPESNNSILENENEGKSNLKIKS